MIMNGCLILLCRGTGSMLALVWHLSEYIAMLALHTEVLAMLLVPCNEALANSHASQKKLGF